MAQSDIDNRPNLNTGTEWPQMDLTDLMDMLLRGESIAEMADFLCRSRREVREKVIQLGDACKASLGLSDT